MSRVSVMIALHKPYRVPEDPLYLPVFVGSSGKADLLGIDGKPLRQCVRDDEGDNISALNPGFCELTALYWGWKNLDQEYLGLVHYRRYFALYKTKDPFDGILLIKEFEQLPRRRAFVPKRRHYVIETLYSHYAHTHYAEHLDVTRDIIKEKCPEYLDAFDRTIRQRSGYMFNMMILEKPLYDAYCGWLFDVLFELRNRMEEERSADRTNLDEADRERFSAYQSRFYGRVSEILFNVWLNRALETGMLKQEELCELPWISMEKTSLLRKGTAFLKAKFFRKKYRGSF